MTSPTCPDTIALGSPCGGQKGATLLAQFLTFLDQRNG
jgi:hypothetical protein